MTNQPTQTDDLGAIGHQVWSGTITATDPTTQADTALQNLNAYYVEADLREPVRCIDGRPDPAASDTNLGPQIPGGTPGAALARRFAGGTAGTMLDEAKLLIDAAIEHGLVPGGHRDDHTVNLPACGCGAVDKMDLALQVMVDSQNESDLRRLVGALLGESFDEAMYDDIILQARSLSGQATAYFENRAEAIDYLESKQPGSAPELRGVHNEYFVVINTVPGTTLATNRFGADNGIQAFGYDFWYTLKEEVNLVPEADRTAFITARAMTAVATLMVLTDGSQHLIVRA